MSRRHNVLVAKCLACKMSGCQNVSPSKCQSVEMLRCQKWVVCKMSGAEMSENHPGMCTILCCVTRNDFEPTWFKFIIDTFLLQGVYKSTKYPHPSLQDFVDPWRITRKVFSKILIF